MTKETANTILKQLGGNGFIAMTGAKQFGCDDNSLTFKIGRNNKSINYVKVTLTALDLYTMEFFKISNGIKTGFKKKVIDSFENVYFDKLQDLFTTATGLYVTL